MRRRVVVISMSAALPLILSIGSADAFIPAPGGSEAIYWWPGRSSPATDGPADSTAAAWEFGLAHARWATRAPVRVDAMRAQWRGSGAFVRGGWARLAVPGYAEWVATSSLGATSGPWVESTWRAAGVSRSDAPARGGSVRGMTVGAGWSTRFAPGLVMAISARDLGASSALRRYGVASSIGVSSAVELSSDLCADLDVSWTRDREAPLRRARCALLWRPIQTLELGHAWEQGPAASTFWLRANTRLGSIQVWRRDPANRSLSLSGVAVDLATLRPPHRSSSDLPSSDRLGAGSKVLFEPRLPDSAPRDLLAWDEWSADVMDTLAAPTDSLELSRKAHVEGSGTDPAEAALGARSNADARRTSTGDANGVATVAPPRWSRRELASSLYAAPDGKPWAPELTTRLSSVARGTLPIDQLAASERIRWLQLAPYLAPRDAAAVNEPSRARSVAPGHAAFGIRSRDAGDGRRSSAARLRARWRHGFGQTELWGESSATGAAATGPVGLAGLVSPQALQHARGGGSTRASNWTFGAGAGMRAMRFGVGLVAPSADAVALESRAQAGSLLSPRLSGQSRSAWIEGSVATGLSVALTREGSETGVATIAARRGWGIGLLAVHGDRAESGNRQSLWVQRSGRSDRWDLEVASSPRPRFGLAWRTQGDAWPVRVHLRARESIVGDRNRLSTGWRFVRALSLTQNSHAIGGGLALDWRETARRLTSGRASIREQHSLRADLRCGEPRGGAIALRHARTTASTRSHALPFGDSVRTSTQQVAWVARLTAPSAPGSGASYQGEAGTVRSRRSSGSVVETRWTALACVREWDRRRVDVGMFDLRGTPSQTGLLGSRFWPSGAPRASASGLWAKLGSSAEVGLRPRSVDIAIALLLPLAVAAPSPRPWIELKATFAFLPTELEG